MEFLLTNDDGIDAAGLEAMLWASARLGQTTVVAPHEPHSGCSHRATTSRPLALDERQAGRHALDGTPVDCARVGLLHLAPHIDWVLAGINHGGNLGADVYLSGTVAAVREAALLGRRGIAVSQFRRNRDAVDWETAGRWTQDVLEMLLATATRGGRFWNVNLPDPRQFDGCDPEIVFCEMDLNPLPVRYEVEGGRLHYRGSYTDRARTAGHDVDLCFSGKITVTEFCVEAT